MSDPLSITCGVIAIWDLAEKIATYGRAARDAAEDWLRYKNSLRVVASTQGVLGNILKTFPHIRDLPIQENENQYSFVEYVNGELSRVVDDASTVLIKRKPLQGWSVSQLVSFRAFFSGLKKTTGFVLGKDRILKMIENVNSAQKNLHIALTLASLHTSESWRTQAGDLLKAIKAEVSENSRTLERIENGKMPREERLKVEIEVRPKPYRNSYGPSKGRSKINQEKMADGSSSSKIMKKLNKLLPYRKKTKRSDSPVDHPCDRNNNNENDNDDGNDHGDENATIDEGHMLDDVSIDNNQPCYEIVKYRGTAEKTAEHIPLQLEYDATVQDGEWFQVPVNTEENHQAILAPTDHNVEVDHPFTVLSAICASHVINYMSNEEWDEAQYIPVEEFADFTSSVNDTEYLTDVETSIDESSVDIQFACPTKVFISETINLLFCSDGISASSQFCVDYVTVTDGMQVFAVTQPCPTYQSIECKHITLRLTSVPESTTLSIMIPLARINSSDCLDSGSHNALCRRSCKLTCVPRCRRQSQCRHTKIEQGQHSKVRCSGPAKLYGLPVETKPTANDSDDHIDQATSYNETQNIPNPWFRMNRSSHNDEHDSNY